jgi:hypothetical protein
MAKGHHNLRADRQATTALESERAPVCGSKGLELEVTDQRVFQLQHFSTHRLQLHVQLETSSQVLRALAFLTSTSHQPSPQPD